METQRDNETKSVLAFCLDETLGEKVSNKQLLRCTMSAEEQKEFMKKAILDKIKKAVERNSYLKAEIGNEKIEFSSPSVPEASKQKTVVDFFFEFWSERDDNGRFRPTLESISFITKPNGPIRYTRLYVNKNTIDASYVYDKCQSLTWYSTPLGLGAGTASWRRFIKAIEKRVILSFAYQVKARDIEKRQRQQLFTVSSAKTALQHHMSLRPVDQSFSVHVEEKSASYDHICITLTVNNAEAFKISEVLAAALTQYKNQLQEKKGNDSL